MLLRNLDNYEELIDVNSQCGSITYISDPAVEEKIIKGSFFIHDNFLFGLYAENGLGWLIICGKLFQCDSRITTQNVAIDNQRLFQVIEDDSVIFEVKYTPKKPYWNFFAMEDEDVDNFLWLHNVISTPLRREILLKESAQNG